MVICSQCIYVSKVGTMVCVPISVSYASDDYKWMITETLVKVTK
jgi:hypothetical protein